MPKPSAIQQTNLSTLIPNQTNIGTPLPSLTPSSSTPLLSLASGIPIATSTTVQTQPTTPQLTTSHSNIASTSNAPISAEQMINNPSSPNTTTTKETEPKKKPTGNNVLEMDPNELALFLAPECYDKPFEAGNGDVLFVGFPTTLDKDNDDRLRIIEQLSKENQKQYPLFDLVHVVFALQRGRDVYSVKDQFKRVSSLYAAALKREEFRCGYLAREYDLIFSCREKAMKESIEESSKIDARIRQFSTLAEQLSTLFLRLRVCGQASLIVNSWSLVSLSIIPPMTITIDQLRPYHTIILTDTDLTEFPKRIAPEIDLLLSFAKPTKSFAEIELGTGVPLKHLYKLACHLMQWKCAMIIDVVNESSLFTFNSNPSIPICSPPITLAQKFQKDCSDSPECLVDPFSILQQFHKVQSLARHLSDVCESFPTTQHKVIKDYFIKVLYWAIRHSFIVQVHTYYFRTIDTLKELDKLLEQKEVIPPEMIEAFQKIFTLLDGSYHFEELVFRTDFKPSELKEILETFRFCVVEIVH